MGFDRRDRQIEIGMSKFSILLIEGAHIGAMSLLVILFLWFGYFLRSPSGKGEGLLLPHGDYYLLRRRSYRGGGGGRQRNVGSTHGT